MDVNSSNPSFAFWAIRLWYILSTDGFFFVVAPCALLDCGIMRYEVLNTAEQIYYFSSLHRNWPQGPCFASDTS